MTVHRSCCLVLNWVKHMKSTHLVPVSSNHNKVLKFFGQLLAMACARQICIDSTHLNLVSSTCNEVLKVLGLLHAMACTGQLIRNKVLQVLGLLLAMACAGQN
uniref:Uncharacterized protein n=1 Tax=Dunaliella tertiolecta TaxID=3047 RepID=A0A6S8JSD2_DUNTE